MKKPKGYWQNPENVKAEVFAIVDQEGWTAIPSLREIHVAGFPNSLLHMIGGRQGLSKITGLPLGKTKAITNNTQAFEKWEGKPSKAFEIEAEARKKGMCYADIQKAKTLAMVGGVQI